jgi:hypothetical protein
VRKMQDRSALAYGTRSDDRRREVAPTKCPPVSGIPAELLFHRSAELGVEEFTTVSLVADVPIKPNLGGAWFGRVPEVEAPRCIDGVHPGSAPYFCGVCSDPSALRLRGSNAGLVAKHWPTAESRKSFVFENAHDEG